MKIYFTFKGNDFKNYSLENIVFDYIQFTSNGKDYILETYGDLDISFEETKIDGRFKGEFEAHESKKISEREIKDAIANLDENTFEIGMFEFGNEPDWNSLEVEIMYDNLIRCISRSN